MVEVLRWQSEVCGAIGSPLYERLLAAVADDVEADGPCWDVLEAHAGGDRQSMPVLRFMGAVHRLVLTGGAPDLARFYPTTGGTDDGDPWPAFLATVTEHADALREDSHRGVQTNEVGRCGALLGGFLLAAQATGLPLRLLELGSERGAEPALGRVPLRRRRRRGLGRPGVAGPHRARLRRDAPPLDVAAEVAQRRGCDLNPVDLDERGGTPRSCPSPGPTRPGGSSCCGRARGRRAGPGRGRRDGAATWLRARLAEPSDGLATVVFHSIVMQYLPEEERAQVEALVRAAGTRATEDAPLAWLRMEPQADDHAGVWLDLWPSGRQRQIARSGYHGRPTRWSGWDG